MDVPTPTSASRRLPTATSRARVREAHRRAVRYGVAFGIVVAGLGAVAFGDDAQTTQERVAIGAAMVMPVASYLAWLASSRRRTRMLVADDEAEASAAQVDVAERVRVLLDSFDAERRSSGAPDPFRDGRRRPGPDAVSDGTASSRDDDPAAPFRSAITLPHADVVDEHWRTLRPAQGTTRPA